WTRQCPGASRLSLLACPRTRMEASGGRLTLLTDDRPGIFSRVAGVLALHGLDVLQAAAYSGDEGRALASFRVSDPLRPEVPWPRVVADLELALVGRLAIHARLAERARTYGRSRPPVTGPAPTVTFDDDASTNATVIDVRAPDAIGV